MSRVLEASIKTMVGEPQNGIGGIDHVGGITSLARSFGESGSKLFQGIHASMDALISWHKIPYEPDRGVTASSPPSRPEYVGMLSGFDGLNVSDSEYMARNLIEAAKRSGLPYNADTWMLLDTETVGNTIGPVYAMVHEATVLHKREPNVRRALARLSGGELLPGEDNNLDLRDHVMVRIESYYKDPGRYHATDVFVYPNPHLKTWDYPVHRHNDELRGHQYAGDKGVYYARLREMIQNGYGVPPDVLQGMMPDELEELRQKLMKQMQNDAARAAGIRGYSVGGIGGSGAANSSTAMGPSGGGISTDLWAREMQRQFAQASGIIGPPPAPPPGPAMTGTGKIKIKKDPW